MVGILASAPRMDEVSPAAWDVGAGLIVLETYFFAALLRAWMEDRRARVASKRRLMVGGIGDVSLSRTE